MIMHAIFSLMIKLLIFNLHKNTREPSNLNLRQYSHLLIKRTHKPCIMFIEACSSFDLQEPRAISIRLSDNVKNDTKQTIKHRATL